MAYTNSSLVTYKKISPNKTSPRNHTIDTVTIHCMVAQWTAKQACDYFANSNVQASCNYAVGKDGSIGLCVEEKDRSWCTSSYVNDNRAITIEVASDMKHPYAVTNEAYNALIKLLVDICKRNDIRKLIWSTNKTDRVNHKNGCNMTVHRDYANKACPGEYLYNKHGEIAKAVNNQLGSSTSTDKSTSTVASTITNTNKNTSTNVGISANTHIVTGAKLTLKNVPLYTSSTSTAKTSLKTGVYYVWSNKVANNRIRITNTVANVGKTGYVTGWINYTDAENAVGASKFSEYKVKVIADTLHIHKGAGTNYTVVGKIKDKGVYTIVEETTTGNLKWGLLKSYKNSRNGWILLKHTKKLN